MTDRKYKTGSFPYGPVMMCPECNTKLQSRYRGEFVMCKCPNEAFVDQVGEYSRYGAMSRATFPVEYKEKKDGQRSEVDTLQNVTEGVCREAGEPEEGE